MTLSAVAQEKKQPFQIPEPAGGPFTLEQAYEHTIAMAKAEPENDTIAYRFLPGAMRPYVATIYAFCRATHDFSTEAKYEGEREAALEAWEKQLLACFHGHASHPIFIALRDTMERFNLPVTPFQDYVIGARMNARVRRYASFQQLMGYVEKAGSSIGRIILQMAGSTEPDDMRAADDIATAMFLSNLFTHCARDFDRGRIYIPQEDLIRFGVTESDFQQRRLTKEFRALIDFQIARTRLYLKRGRPVFDRLPKGYHAQLQLIWLGVSVALDNIEADKFDVFNKDHGLRTQDWARAAVRLAAWRVKDFTQW